MAVNVLEKFRKKSIIYRYAIDSPIDDPDWLHGLLWKKIFLLLEIVSIDLSPGRNKSTNLKLWVSLNSQQIIYSHLPITKQTLMAREWLHWMSLEKDLLTRIRPTITFFFTTFYITLYYFCKLNKNVLKCLVLEMS